MSARKVIRNGYRSEAEFRGVNASRFVAQMFDRRQIKKYGATVRIINQAKGTKPRRVWRERILGALGIYYTHNADKIAAYHKSILTK